MVFSDFKKKNKNKSMIASFNDKTDPSMVFRAILKKKDLSD